MPASRSATSTLLSEYLTTDSRARSTSRRADSVAAPKPRTPAPAVRATPARRPSPVLSRPAAPVVALSAATAPPLVPVIRTFAPTVVMLSPDRQARLAMPARLRWFSLGSRRLSRRALLLSRLLSPRLARPPASSRTRSPLHHGRRRLSALRHTAALAHKSRAPRCRAGATIAQTTPGSAPARTRRDRCASLDQHRGPVDRAEVESIHARSASYLDTFRTGIPAPR